MVRHSSHSFGTPLQPAHTSDLLGGYKRRWGTPKEGEQALDISASLSPCLDLLFDRKKMILLKRDCINYKMREVFAVVILCISLVRKSSLFIDKLPV